ncbi:multiubiquitin domain-containing protein [Polluticaenibacter yanchengensis]|uniref:Multiubiquitin domain-containing protein n=1 Tax=Polluticaenibacter yanchengensis TaxID=3014562 RepID=A0ABT4UPA3_9BACT|nr:multiubiquitin domain-containing protein [Chitinophagaceae bacterium LY-5]
MEKSIVVLKFIVEDIQFEWPEQYIAGSEVKALIGAPLESELYLAIKEPWANELISNSTKVNLARPGIERFFFKNIYSFVLNDKTYRSYKSAVTGEELLSIAGIQAYACYTLYEKFSGCDFTKIRHYDIVDLSRSGIERFVTKDADTFAYTLNGEHEMTDKKRISAEEILENAGIDTVSNYLVHKTANGEFIYAWNPKDYIEMDCSGMEFISRSWVDIVSIEDSGKSCEEIPPAKVYRIRIDKSYFDIMNRYIEQSELIRLGGKSDTVYNVLKFIKGNPKPVKIAVGEKVDLTETCLLRFVLQPKEQTEGRDLRKQFQLPEEDSEILNQLGYSWETISQGNYWIIIHDYPIPAGYNVLKADVALLIPPGYPATQIDMAYFYPALNKTNTSVGVRALSNQSLDGRIFQRWSRHRKPNEWTPGVDNIATHLHLVDNWLEKELKK